MILSVIQLRILLWPPSGERPAVSQITYYIFTSAQCVHTGKFSEILGTINTQTMC